MAFDVSKKIQFVMDVVGHDKVQAGVKGVTDGLYDSERAASFAQKAFVGLIGIASVGAFASMVKGVIDFNAQLHDMAQQTGLSVAALAQFKSIGALTETGLDAITGASAKLSKNLALLGDDGKGAGIALNALGINFDAFKKLNPEQQMLEVAKAMGQFEDGTDKTAAAMLLFGKQGAAMLPFLHDLGEEADKITAKLTDQEKALKANQAAMADAFGDNLTKIRKESEGWRKDIATGLLPALYEASEVFLSMTGGAGGLKDQIAQLAKDGTLAEWARGGVVAITYVVDVVQGLWNMLRIVQTFLTGLVAGVVTVADTVDSVGERIKAGDLSGAIGEIGKGFEKVKTVGVAAGEDIANLWGAKLMGQSFRDRMADIKGVGVAVDGTRKKLANLSDVAAQLERQRKAAAEAEKERQRQEKEGERIYDEMRKAGLAYIDALDKETVALQQQEDAGRALTETEKKAIAFEEALRTGKILLTTSEEAHARATLAANAALEANVTWMKQANAENDRAADAIDKQTTALEKQLRDLTESTSLIGLNAEQINAHELALINDQKAAVLARAALLDMIDPSAAAALRDQATLWDQIGLARAKAFDAKQAAELQKAWTDAANNIATGFFESLTHGVKSAVDYVKNTLKNLALKVLVQGVMGGLGGIYDNLTGQSNSLVGQATGAYNTASLAGGAYGAITGYSPALNAAAGWLGAGSSVGASGASLAYGNAVGAAGGDGLGAMIAANGSWSGVAAGGAAEGAGAAAGAGAAGGIGEMAAAFGPYAAVILALYAIFSDHSKWSLGSVAGGQFGSDGTFGTTKTDLPFAFGNNTEHDRPGSMEALLGSIGALISGTATSFGGKPVAGLGLSAATDLDRTGQAAGILALLLNGQRIGGVQTGTGAFAGNDPGAATKIAADQLQAWFQGAVPQLLVQALQHSELEPRFADYFNSIGAVALTADKAKEMLATAASVKNLTDALEPLGGVFGKLNGLSVQATLGLAGLVGGMDQLISKAQGYVQSFYTQGEQTAIAATQIAQVLKAAGIDTSKLTDKASFRAAVDATGATIDTATGQAQLAALLNVNQQFAAIADQLGGLSLDAVAAAAPQVAALQQLQSPTEATAAATQATAEATTTVADNTAATTAAVADVADATDLNTQTSAAGFKLLAEKLDKLLVTLTDIDRLSTQAEARAAGGQG